MFEDNKWARDIFGCYRKSTKFQIRQYFIQECDCKKTLANVLS